MAFWVYGHDAASGEPGQMLSDAATEEAARQQARDQGLVPDRVEPAPPPSRWPAAAAPEPPRSGRWWNLWLALGVVLLCLWAFRLRSEIDGLREKVEGLEHRLRVLEAAQPR